MGDVTFEEEVLAWASFCRKDGTNAVPVTRSEVEEHMRKRYSVAGSEVPITQEELDLIFDYTCDACESYILEELIGKHNWELQICEDFLMGRHPGGNKIRYCSETVKTSILNLKFASRFDSLSRTSTAPTAASLASLILTNTGTASLGSSVSSLPPFHPSGTTSNSSTPPSSSSLSSLPGYAPNPEKSSPSLVTSSAPQPSTLVPSTQAIHATPAQKSNYPPIPPRPGHASHAQIHYDSVPLSSPLPSTAPLSKSSPIVEKSPPPAVGPKPSRMVVTPKSVTPPKSTATGPPQHASSAPSPSSPSSNNTQSASDLSDGRIAGSSGKVCTKISTFGFCSPRDCPHIHNPEWTMCKHLTLNGQCLVRGCPYQHPNVATRQVILTPIINGTNRQYISAVQSGQSIESIQDAQHQKGLQRPLSLAEWNTLRLTMVFYCTIQMREKKCGKGGECTVVDCPKQHKKLSKPAAGSGTQSSSAPAQAPISSSVSATNLTKTNSGPKPPLVVHAAPASNPHQTHLPPKTQSTPALHQHQPHHHTQSSPGAPTSQHLPQPAYATHKSTTQAASPHAGHPPPPLPAKNASVSQPQLLKAHVASNSTPGQVSSAYQNALIDAPAPTTGSAIVKAKYSLKNVTGQANHMNLVSSIMQGGSGKTGKQLKIKKLEEVHNELIDAQYREFFTATQAQTKFRPSEIYAFHGAPSAAVHSIAENGFDMSKIKRTKFGHGLYCALDPSVSVEYCGTGNQMILVRLITDGLKWVKDPAYYVVHNSSSMNPLYIITFEK